MSLSPFLVSRDVTGHGDENNYDVTLTHASPRCMAAGPGQRNRNPSMHHMALTLDLKHAHTHTHREAVRRAKMKTRCHLETSFACVLQLFGISYTCKMSVCVYIHTNTDRQTDGQTDRQTHGQTNRQTHRQAHRHMHRHTDAQTHRHTNTQKNRQPQTDSQTDPRMCAYVYTYTFTRGMSLLIAICKLSNSGMCPYQP